jgi:hypothetical protein
MKNYTFSIFVLCLLCMPRFSNAGQIEFFEKIAIGQIDRSDLQKEYPFFMKVVSDHPEALIAAGEFQNQKNENFLILRIEDSFFCGTRGCSTDLYKMNDSGSYEHIEMSIVVNTPIYRKICKNNFSLVFAPGGGVPATYSEWQYNGVNFTFVAQYPSLEAVAKCQP